jgi:hypothetical protein
MHPWAMLSGGAGSGIYKSTDSGTTWTRLGPAPSESPTRRLAQGERRVEGLPRSPLGKIDVAVAPSDSNRVYALIQTNDQGSVWRSDDGGTSWRVVNWSRELIGRAGYYIHLAVSPVNEDEILVSNSSFFQSTDGGHTFSSVNWGGDNHDIWWDSKDPDRFAITHDAGITLTTQHGRSTQTIGNIRGLPKLTEHPLSDPRPCHSSTIVRLTVHVENNGSVIAHVSHAMAWVQQVRPVPVDIAEMIASGKDPVPSGSNEIDWPLAVESKECDWSQSPCEIEPDEVDDIQFDFVVPPHIEAVQVYSHDDRKH